jgi:hypothetical protein
MIQVEPIQNFNGFGSGRTLLTSAQTQVGTPGEYFYSQGMTRSQFGIVPNWSIAKVKDNVDLTTLQLINFFTQGQFSSTNYVWAFDTQGNVYRSTAGLGDWTLHYKPSGSVHGNGIFFDQKNRLLVATDRYLAKNENGASYTTGTVALTNGSANVVGSGTTFNAGMVGQQFQITGETAFYTILSFTDATHITLSTNYTGTTGSGKTYTIYTGWTEQWKDFGASYETSDYRQMDAYEDWVVISNLNAIALLNVTDDSFNNIALNLPAGYVVRTVRAGRTGILIGLNFNNKGAVLLWDAYSNRSIAPWIWFNANIKAVIPTDSGWYVITSRGIYLTDGYSRTSVLDSMPDGRKNRSSILTNVIPQGVELIENYLVFWGTNSNYNRQRSGLWLFNLTSKLFEFAPVSNGVTYGVSGGAIFFDNNNTTHLSYSTGNPAKRFIGRLDNSNPSRAILITELLGLTSPNEKVAEGVKLILGLNTQQTETATKTFDASVKIANLRRNLWSYVQTNNASATANVLNINGTIFSYYATIGDEVTILDGVNAGQVRHITAITNQGLSNEQWTLDSAFSSTTESGVNISVSPFKLVRKYSLSSITELKELYFDVQNRIKGKQYLVKILLENMASNLELELKGGQFIYDDLGVRR